MGKVAPSETKALNRRIRQYQIVGRAAPTEKKPDPKIFRMKLFARDHIMAKNKFWYFMKKLCCAKKTGGEILAVNELFEKKPLVVKNYGVWLRYESRTDTHNMYKEYRATTLTDAIAKMYCEMAGRHRADAQSIQVIKTAAIKAADCRRPHVTQFHKNNLKFPLTRRMPHQAKQYKSTFTAKRPTIYLK